MYAEVFDVHQQFLAMRTMQDCSCAEAVAVSSGVVAVHRESELLQAIAHHEGLREKEVLFFLSETCMCLSVLEHSIGFGSRSIYFFIVFNSFRGCTSASDARGVQDLYARTESHALAH